jgi:urease accessory protein
MMLSPFACPESRPGQGIVHLTLLPPATPTFSTLSYTYPLKLLPSTPHKIPSQPHCTHKSIEDSPASGSKDVPSLFATLRPTTCPLLFLLSYGGGLLPPDSINVQITLDPHTRLTATTQGSTKIFPSTSTIQCDGVVASKGPTLATRGGESKEPIASQTLDVTVGEHAALLLFPDPTQPFRSSRYTQKQVFSIHKTSSLGVLDWVTEGRHARGEEWCAAWWQGKNEVWLLDNEHGQSPVVDCTARKSSRCKLLLRDNVILDGRNDGEILQRMHGNGVSGTIILYGTLLDSLSNFFMEEFSRQPRIGGRDWGDSTVEISGGSDHERFEKERAVWRTERWKLESEAGVLWTSARVRGMVLVKFGARHIEGAKMWLQDMLHQEGSLAHEFGEGAMMCLR